MRAPQYGKTAPIRFRTSVTLALLSCLSSMTALNARAQATVVQGRVFERAVMDPVAGAIIKLAGRPDVSAVTDTKGVFKIIYATSTLRASESHRETPAAKGRPAFFRWMGDWRDADGKLRLKASQGSGGLVGGGGPEGPGGPGGPGGSDGVDGPEAAFPVAKPTAGTGTLDVSCPGLLPKSVAITDATQDLGDIVLDYPPRKLDIGAPPIYGSFALFDGKRATMDSEWEHWMGAYRKTNWLGIRTW